MRYYIVENQKPTGPFEIEELVARGIKGSDLVWTTGMKDWVPAESVEEIRVAIYSSASPRHGETGMPEFPPQPPISSCPEPPYTQPAYTQPANTAIPPKTWLAESILVTLFCCLPLGIVGIIKASGVSSLWQAGNYAEAEQASASAKKWVLWGFIAGIIAVVLYIITVIVSVATQASLGEW